MQQVRQLSQEFNPTNYHINLAFQRQARTLSGEVTLIGSLPHEAAAIPLHAKDLVFTSIKIDGQEATATMGGNDEVALATDSPLAAGEHTVTMTFTGKITDNMNGLYPCYFTLDGKDEELLATQFESHYAREVFPCVDEPAAKATFDLTLTTEKEVTVIANTPVASQQEEDDALITTFETTPVMSTYLLAWAVGKLDYKEATTKDGVVVRAYATPDNVDKTQFALDTAVKTLELYNEYFGTPYPLAKCDMIALPDFSSGAMENWGLITYRESAFFVDERTSTITKQHVVEIVAHELAHQWFGNLVTMQWWNDLWLNESFATWMSNYAQNELYPERQMWTQFYNEETAYALDRDALKSVQSVQQEVHHPDEIRTLFDPAIVYAKGASLVHMVHAYMGDTAFREGLQAYMKKHAYGNTAAADLWNAWTEASGKDIGAFLTPWISQSGHPMVRATITDQEVQLSQERFFSNPKDFDQNDPTIWPIPLLAGDALKEEVLADPQATFALQTTDKPFLLNQGRTAFYVPLYPEAHLTTLAEQVRNGQMDTTDRLALLNEAYDLARAGQQPTLQMLKLLEAYQHEASEPVWDAISSAIAGLRLLTEDDEAIKPKVRAFVGNLAREQYERLGWDRIEGESHFDQLLRPAILSLMGFSEDPMVHAKAKELLASASKPEEILGDIRGVVFSINARFGDEQAFEKLFNWVKTERSPEVRTQLTAGICSVRDQAHIQQVIDILKSKYVKQQDLFYWLAYMARNKDTRKAIWQWTQDEWEWITKNFESDMHYTTFPRYLAAAFSTKEGLAEYKRFFEPKINHPMLSREIKQGYENIESRLLWRERDYQAVADYLGHE